MRARSGLAALLATALATTALAGCTTGAAGSGTLPPAPPKATDGTTIPVVVDTDLGADDLLALAYLLRHPQVEVRALTVPTTGLVGCEAGLAVLGGLLEALDADPVPVACGEGTAGPSGRPFPAAWRASGEAGWGLEPRPGVLQPDEADATELLAEQARIHEDLVLVALGPLTDVAALAQDDPEAYARLAGVHAMAGSLAGPAVDGVAEWNAAADPDALAAVLSGPVPVTVVPEDAVPPGTPTSLTGAVVGRVSHAAELPAWWDLAAVVALVAPEAGEATTGSWTVDEPPGRLVRAGRGDVSVYRSLDASRLEEEYARAFPG